MPYRIDIAAPTPEALDLLIEMGALDVDRVDDGLAAILPDAVPQETVTGTFGVDRVTISRAVARDDESVWLLGPRVVRIGNALFAPPGVEAPRGTLRLKDSSAFGTGHHPTTAMCVEALEELLAVERTARILDVGTGSGILAIAALKMGVGQAVGVDLDASALTAAAENARLNDLGERLQLVHGGPEAVSGCWSLVVANVLAAPLIEMAPVLVQRVGSQGVLILSGIPLSVETEVRKAYERLGMQYVSSQERGGWVVLTTRASW